jgi:two-component system phosphate regulon sensor histidine kinase PhoR
VRAVRVAADLAELDRSVSALRRTFAAAGALALASALAISALLVARSLRSLGELREVVDSIARGELDRRLRWRSGDEREEIAQAINRMADELRRRLREADGERGRLQAVLSGMFEGVLVVGADGRVVLANPSFRRLFSVWGDVAGRTALELVRHPAVDDLLREAALSSETLERELEVGSPTGQASRSLLVHAARFPEQGERLGTLAVFHDVTEIRRLEGLRRDFVANVSHELKTPLTAIRGFAETLAAGDVPPDRVKGFVGIILRHAERLERLIDDLLVLSRVESRKLPLDLGPVDVARVAVSVVRGMEPQLGAHRVTAEVRSDGAPAAWADRRAVEQILTNLVDNAVKYSEPGGRIQIEVEGEPQHVTLRVRDSGIGIPDEDQPRVFERFYRVDKARSRDLGGTGLGLAIVKHLAQAMGGDASVKSRLGEGSTFRVALPRADRRPQAASH